MKNLKLFGLKAFLPFAVLMLMSCKKQPMFENENNENDTVPAGYEVPEWESYNDSIHYYNTGQPYDTAAAYVIYHDHSINPVGPHYDFIAVCCENYPGRPIRIVTQETEQSINASLHTYHEWWQEVARRFQNIIETYPDAHFDGVKFYVRAVVDHHPAPSEPFVMEWATAQALRQFGCQIVVVPEHKQMIPKKTPVSKKPNALPLNSQSEMLRNNPRTRDSNRKTVKIGLAQFPNGVDPNHAAEYANPIQPNVTFETEYELAHEIAGENMGADDWARFAMSCVDAIRLSDGKIKFSGTLPYTSGRMYPETKEILQGIGFNLVEHIPNKSVPAKTVLWHNQKPR